ncbi:MAG: serine/threonine-protein phosphatase 2B catalytic subunit A1 [Amphiamblys sp. WSBS2006]|nr:MAG: serine/threonine-protein phosphatase 2B catalytic subunit A1 [Amphiamblys sp. WSBS2006]
MERKGRTKYLLDDGTCVETTKRALSFVEAPRKGFLADRVLFRDGVVSPEELCEHFEHGGRMEISQTMKILDDAEAVLKQERNILRLEGCFSIVGDIHGQYLDLVHIFRERGFPCETTRYLFLGDYVDRGYYSFECFLLLAAMKVRWPGFVFLLRGNHESRRVSSGFTFGEECVFKQSAGVYSACVSCFNALPIAAVVDSKLFCVHGGISPQLKHVSDADGLDRFRDIPRSGILCDFLWSDPSPDYDYEARGLFLGPGKYRANEQRMVSWFYGYRAVVEFLERNSLSCVVRGHEVHQQGYRLYKSYRDQYPSVVSIFSAPCYSGVYTNKAVWLEYRPGGLTIRTFSHTRHPFYLPNFQNGISWSLPFLCDKAVVFFRACVDIGLASRRHARTQAKRQVLHSVTARLNRIELFADEARELRVGAEAATELCSPAVDMAPGDALSVKDEEIKAAVHSFQEAHLSDSSNESWIFGTSFEF